MVVALIEAGASFAASTFSLTASSSSFSFFFPFPLPLLLLFFFFFLAHSSHGHSGRELDRGQDGPTALVARGPPGPTQGRQVCHKLACVLLDMTLAWIVCRLPARLVKG